MADSKVRNSTEQEKEVWRPIKGYEGLYKINKKGVIRTKRRKGSKGGILKTHTDDIGYERLRLCKNGKTEIVRLHTLIAEAFIPNPDNKPCINHIDGNKGNNDISNLEWCTKKENNKHAYYELETVTLPNGMTHSENLQQCVEIKITD